MKVDKSFLEGTSNLNKERVISRLSHSNIISNINQELAHEIEDLEKSTQLDVLTILKILSLKVVNNIDLISWSQVYKLMGHLNLLLEGKQEPDIHKNDHELIEDYIDSLNQFSKNFKLVHCLDMLKILVSLEYMLFVFF